VQGGTSGADERAPDDVSTTAGHGDGNDPSVAQPDEEGSYEPSDPHPDTPDDLDDDVAGRESEEAVVPKDP
jgi:hypothetical protein